MSAMGVEDEALESARERSSAGRDLDPGLEAEAEMMGSRGRGLSEMTEEGNSNDGRSLSNDGRRGESSSRSTRGGARPTEDTVVAVVSVLPLRAELALMPNNRVMLGFEANRGDRRGFSIVSETGVIERVEAGISTGGIVVSPKSIILAICPAADGGGGVLNSSSRRSISSENTLPGMLSEGPSESIRARIVIRFVSWCDAISERRLTISARRNQCAGGSIASKSLIFSSPSFRRTASNRGCRTLVRRGCGNSRRYDFSVPETACGSRSPG